MTLSSRRRALHLLYVCLCLVLVLLSFRGTAKAATSATSSSFYSVLGVDKSANEGAIKKAYRRLAMKHHPDKGGDAEQFKRLNEAYSVLSDKAKREQYDLYGEEGLRPGGGSRPFSGQQQKYYQQQRPGGGYDTRTNPFPFSGEMGIKGINDLLSQLFGGTGGEGVRRTQQQQQQHLPPFVQPFACSLEELYRGCRKKFRIRDTVIGFGGQRVPIEQTFTLNVEPGWKTGTRITFKPSQSFPRKVTFVLQMRAHDQYLRQGDDILVSKPVRISIQQHADGARIPIKLLDGTTHQLVVKAKDERVRNGGKMVLRGIGMPKSQRRRKGGRSGAAGRGDLVITFEVG